VEKKAFLKLEKKAFLKVEMKALWEVENVAQDMKNLVGSLLAALL